MDDFNKNCVAYVLYYLGNECKSATPYAANFNNVCEMKYDENENAVITDWHLADYKQPDLAHLATYNLADVLEWYHNFYELPRLVASFQHIRLSAEEIEAMRADDSMIDFMVYDTTARRLRRWTGEEWALAWP
jgi:hypothetical protein